MSVSISPVFNGQQFFDNDGLPLDGGKLFQYEAGSYSTEQTSYSDNTGNVANPNPIVLDSSGRMPVDIWLTDGSAYNLVLTAPDGTTVLTGVDDVVGVVSSTSGGQLSTAVWTEVLDVPTYVNATQFLVPGNLVQEFAVGNRVQCESTPGSYTYGTVSAVTYSNPNTQVTLANDQASISVGLTKVYWSVMTAAGPAVDAGAITYSVPNTYVSSYTLGYKIKQQDTATATTNNNLAATRLVYAATGTNDYAITVNASITSYSTQQVFTVKFTNANTGAATININNVGAVSLQSYDSAGALQIPNITAGLVSNIAYNGTVFVLLNQLPAGSGGGGSTGGCSVYTSNDSWTCPVGVTSVRVTCVGGGGGGGLGGSTGGEYSENIFGGNGGAGGVGIKTITVVPGDVYNISIGAGGSSTGPTAGGATSFGGGLVVATGGAGGANYTPINGANGYGSVANYGTNASYSVGTIQYGYSGSGGWGSGVFGTNGGSGLCILEY